MSAVIPNLLLAGLLLASLEIVWVWVRARSLFLSLGERLLFALASSTGITSCVLLLGLALWSAVGSTRLAQRCRVGWALAGGALGGSMLWSLSEGRRVRELAARPYVVVLLALAAAAALYLLPLLVQRVRGGPRLRGWVAATCLLLALGALAADALVLPRGYPAFHLGLAFFATLLACTGALVAPPVFERPAPRRVLLVSALVLLVAPLSLGRLSSHPTAGFAVRETAPWSARLTRLVTPRRERARPTVSTAASTPVTRQGVDLRDRDVLLITVDALRADMLRAYGGKGRTPELDALAERSAVFEHAYTPAPHTSYALASLLTGKFVKPLVELGEKLGDPPTLPDRLRRYGYRTAAFYPPAIFFVDGASFEPLHKRGFGFEYRKEMFASAPERVSQLSEYLVEADPKKPLFVWVHLFEPHEPYAPPADEPHDGSERGRYEAEVAVCDRAIAALVRRFREARPRATVIVTADHGEEFGDHGGSFHGTSLYEEQVHIPLLWSSPGVVAPRRIASPVELTDVGTTILSTAGIPRDAHMRGDELGAVLAGHDDEGPTHAFASIDARHMISDGRHKLICSASDVDCALFDVHDDPSELHNLVGKEPALARQLREALDAFLSSIARTEAVTVSEGVRLPEVLARAKVFGSTRVDELTPLLVDSRVAVRLEAARVLGELGDPRAQPFLSRVLAHDDDAQVRSEAAIASLALGDSAPLAAVLALLRAFEADAGFPRDAVLLSRVRRAALSLTRFERAEAVPVLADWLRDEGATESERLRVVRGLGTLHTETAVAPLAEALGLVRLREAAALALGQLGGPEAARALRLQLQAERYPPARAAEARALLLLADPSVPGQVRHYLGMESSLPLGVRLLAELGALTPSSRAGALLTDTRVRAGDWRCSERGCAPGESALVRLPASGGRARGPVRVTVWFRDAAAGSVLVIDDKRFPLLTTEDQVSFLLPSAAQAERLSFARQGEVVVSAVVVVASVPEIPPPTPEPWELPDAGSPVDSTPVL
jgi:arylsulfatase A-like enzyme